VAKQDRVDALYGLPLEEFTSARKELADELRGGGDRETAKDVAGLSKPTTSAWAVNQVMRTQRTDARALLDAGERLRKAHSATAAGKADAADLRDAVLAERDAVERLTQAARGLTNSQGRGLSEPLLERVRQTLHAVSVDSEVRALAEAGRLTSDHQASGAEALGDFAANRRGRKPTERRSAQAKKLRDRIDRAESALDRVRAEARKAGERVTAKEAEIEDLRRQLDQLK
jgi:hypothetical protein